jgi:hypothetical protein
MKNNIIVLLLLLSNGLIYSQIHEIGGFLGGANYIGDVGKTTYIDPSEIAIGGIYKWNKSPWHSYRFSIIQSKISGNDSESEVPGRKERGYSFQNQITEVSAGMEFNFFNFNLHEELRRKFTSYVHTGLSYFKHQELYIINGQTRQDKSRTALAIPMTVGVKSNIFFPFIIGLEVGARYTFTDNLDGSSPKSGNFNDLKFGNINSNDWYMFSGITITYTFGNKPCYCAD